MLEFGEDWSEYKCCMSDLESEDISIVNACPNCSYAQHNPRFLDCAHSLCSDCCIIKEGKIECPACHYITSATHADNLIPNYMLCRVRVKEETKCRHHGNKLEVWCIDCQELMCATCVLVAHRSHNVKLLEEYGDNAKQELKEAMGEANQLYLNVVKDGDVLERNIDDLEKHYEAALRDIHHQFQELIEAMERKRDEMLSELSRARSTTVGKMKTELKKMKEFPLVASLALVPEILKWNNTREFLEMRSVPIKAFNIFKASQKLLHKEVFGLNLIWKSGPLSSFVRQLSNISISILTPKWKELQGISKFIVLLISMQVILVIVMLSVEQEETIRVIGVVY